MSGKGDMPKAKKSTAKTKVRNNTPSVTYDRMGAFIYSAIKNKAMTKQYVEMIVRRLAQNKSFSANDKELMMWSHEMSRQLKEGVDIVGSLD